jgi:[NiFe] hydrogenase diaphorase moiety small subunit
MLDRNRCIMCGLCVRASREVDGKNVFTIVGRGRESRVAVNSASGMLGDSELSANDAAAKICPVGALLKKRVGYAVPIGKRLYDAEPISAQVDRLANREA